MVRLKNRYITVEIVPEGISPEKPFIIKTGLFHDVVLSKIQQIHGDYGTAVVKSGFLAKYCNETTRIAIIRVRRGSHHLVSSSLPFINKIDKNNVSIRTIHIGATMKHSFKFIQKHQRAHLTKMWLKLKSDEERKLFEEALMNFTKTDVKMNLEKMT